MRVLNIHTDREFVEDDAVAITRPSRWGNPFILGRDGDREAVIGKYRIWLWSQIRSGAISLQELADLDGKQLLCVCKPKPCHGDVLASAAEWATGKLRDESARSGTYTNGL